MTNRDWFCIALRIFGIWILVQAIEQIVPNILFAITSNMPGLGTAYFIVMLIWFTIRTALGLVLLFFAPVIATRFYPSPILTEGRLANIKPLKIGMQILAVYSLLLAVQSGANVINGYLSGATFSRAGNFSNAGGYLGGVVNCGLCLAFAFILIVWNENLITFIEKFRYVAERDAYEPTAIEE